MAALEPVTPRRILRLRCDPCSGAQQLVNDITGEVAQLLGRNGYQLGFYDDDGRGFLVDSTGEPSWADDHLKYEARRQVSTGAVWIVAGAPRVPLSDFAKAAEESSLMVHGPGFAAACVDIFVFDKAHMGFCVWWSLSSLYCALGIGGRASDWYQEGWKR